MTNALRIPHAFSLVLTALLLVMSVWSKQTVARPIPAKSSTEKSTQPTDSQQATIQEFSPMATAPSVVLAFAQELYLLSPMTFVFETARQQVPSLVTPPPRLAYLEVLFEHFIVVNAP